MDTIPASAVNPAAGTHPVTADPRELDAARRASDASLAEFPYYLERYGERGRSFGSSDGGWLVTLCGHDAGHALGQVLWLGRVLAARGMPRWLLERHLEVLHGELVRAVPERAPRYAVLLQASARLAELRRARIADADHAALSAAFDARVGPGLAARLRGMGGILAAAAADEADGLDAAVRSVLAWAADPALFPEPWTAAVLTTVADARVRARGRDG